MDNTEYFSLNMFSHGFGGAGDGDGSSGGGSGGSRGTPPSSSDYLSDVSNGGGVAGHHHHSTSDHHPRRRSQGSSLVGETYGSLYARQDFSDLFKNENYENYYFQNSNLKKPCIKK